MCKDRSPVTLYWTAVQDDKREHGVGKHRRQLRPWHCAGIAHLYYCERWHRDVLRTAQCFA